MPSCQGDGTNKLPTLRFYAMLIVFTDSKLRTLVISLDAIPSLTNGQNLLTLLTGELLLEMLGKVYA